MLELNPRRRWFSAVLVASATLFFLGEVRGGEIFTQKPRIEPARVGQGRDRQLKASEPVKVDAKIDAKVFQSGTAAQWIWGGQPKGDDRYFLRKKFLAAAGQKARMIATCDNQMVVWLNGKRVMQSGNWASPERRDVSKLLKSGANELLVEAKNQGSAAGFALKLVLLDKNGKASYVVSDASWQAAKSKESDEWKSVIAIGKMGVGPWGNVFLQSKKPTGNLLADIPRDVFNVLPGFQVELLYEVPRAQQGSWVSLTFDNKGRMIASDQGGRGLYRITPPPIGSDKPTSVEKLDVKMTSSHGMLYAFDSLYVSVNGGPGSGLYRLRDTNGDDQYDEVKKLKALRGGGEHGPHALRLTPDGKSILIIAGNHTDPPEKFDASRVPRNWGEDLLLPRQWDARGHARGKLAPGGWIAKTDPEGKTWEMVSIGYRNAYDMDINVDGELFAYDADMEWDMGSPWYRPTRVVHAASGSEFGWRSGTGKWPTHYVDSLPPVVDIGPGSPVGVTFGYGARFPAKYQRALYLLDWTFGTIYAIHLTPRGASYVGEREEFLSRSPLPLTDAEVGPDGALYFTVGGRNAQSALYRVTYVGDEATSQAVQPDKEFAAERAVRRKLESFHAKADDPGKAVEAIWPQLSNSDRHIRYAARVALEHQGVDVWRSRALSETNAQALLTASVALARQGKPADQEPLIEALDRLEFSDLSETQQLELLRVYALAFVRLGRPGLPTAARLAKKLDPFYPSKSVRLNSELSRVLVYLNSPTVIDKTLALLKKPSGKKAVNVPELLSRNRGYGGTIAQMLANHPELQKIHYALVLRNMRYGWTLDQRREYMKWLGDARNRSGGASYRGFIDNIRTEALANTSEAEKKALGGSIIPPPNRDTLPKPKGPGRDWTLAEIVKLGQSSLHDRNYVAGKRAYAAAKCVSCHRFDGEGGATGPDLTNAAGRFSLRDLAESMVEPAKTIPDQYRATIIITDDGNILTGRVTREDKVSVTLLVDPFDITKTVTVDKKKIDQRIASKTSLMPDDLAKPLSKDELLDLLAYILSRGNPNDPIFQPAGR